jgi:hypothetical protein
MASSTISIAHPMSFVLAKGTAAQSAEGLDSSLADRAPSHVSGTGSVLASVERPFGRRGEMGHFAIPDEERLGVAASRLPTVQSGNPLELPFDLFPNAPADRMSPELLSV